MARPFKTPADRLRELKKLGPYDQPDDPPPPAAGPEPDAAAVRAWAVSQGIKVRATGRVPADVVAAYLEATT